MARKTTKTYQLSEKGVKQLRDDLEAYKTTLLQKAQMLVEELAKEGIKEGNRRFAVAKGEFVDKSHTLEITNVDVVGNNVVVEITGTGDDIIFIEFGAGIHYNGGKDIVDSSPHPKGEEMGYVIGGYPKGRKGHSLGTHDSWHYKGQVVHGTEATMPMLGIIEKSKETATIDKVCRKVFKS